MTRSDLTGIAVSPGVAIARALCVHDIPSIHLPDPVKEFGLINELALFESGWHDTVVELREIHAKVMAQVGEDDAAIFQAHITIAQDPALTDRIRQAIARRKMTAASAVSAVAKEFEALFLSVSDDFLKDRLVDLQDVLGRLHGHVCQLEPTRPQHFDDPVILVVNELLPSDVITINENHIEGIVTQSGGRTSHAAILARSYGIPAIAGVVGVFDYVNNGDMLVLDGTAGHLFIHPGDEVITAYKKRRRDFSRLRRTLADDSGGPIATRDGESIELLANINCAAEATEAKRVGAIGIGLYRTEFYYLTHEQVPTEDEEVAEYVSVLNSSPNGPVTIRTLDIGGDKTIPFIAHTPEANPFLGWRSIRLSFEHPDLFRQQIRSVYRAASATDKEVRLMFPMVTNYEEVQRIYEFAEQARNGLKKAGIPFGNVKLGMMVEVPAAAVMIDELVKLVDFVSVGSNDLVQYLTAADRDNPKVSHLCQAISPAVLRVLKNVIGECNKAKKPVTVCGEMAGSPRAFPLLLGMGLRCFSMSTSFIPAVRDLAAHISVSEAEGILSEALTMKYSKDIHRLTDDFVITHCPELAPYLIA
jgi:phosphotransferase system enzyme I (PtsI)